MGILNLTPDSFFDGGKFPLEKDYLLHTENMLKAGASIIDVGGYSSRPGASHISEEEELIRVIKPLEKLCLRFPEAVFSIDTFRSKVAEEAIHVGASIINDISAGEDDDTMFAMVAKLKVPYIMMHKKGMPADMQSNPEYQDVVKEVISFFSFKLEKLYELGINDVIIDPGFGFGKTLEHNFALLKNLDLLRMLGLPVLAGLSRKSMINKIINTSPEDALNGSTVLHTLAVNNGASILRVHDVQQAVEVFKLFNYYHEIN